LFFVAGGAAGMDWPNKVPWLSGQDATQPLTTVRLPGSPESGISANQVAATIILGLPPLIGATLSVPDTRPWIRRLLYGVIAVLLGLFLLSQSRTGWLAAIPTAITAALLWWKARGRALRPAFVVLAGATLLVGLLVWQTGWQRVESLLTAAGTVEAVGSLSTVEFRLEVWRWALAAAHDFWLTGCGLGAFRAVAFRFYPIAVPADYDIAHAHNVFLQVLLDLGVLGLVSYLALVGLAFHAGWSVIIRQPGHRLLAIGLVSGLAGLHFFGLADALALGAKPGLLFWIALGLLMAIAQFAPRKPDP
jgi:O-antigen ligase